MTFDIEKTLESMGSAALGVLTGEVDKVKGCVEKALLREKDVLKSLAEDRIKGNLDDKELASELEDEAETLEAQILACEVKAKAGIQKAVNAALKVFQDAIKAVL